MTQEINHAPLQSFTLSAEQVQALGGWPDILTWLKFLRTHKEFIKPIMSAFEDFSNATTWRARLAAIGHLIDAIAAILDKAPTAASAWASEAWEASALEAEFSALRAEFEAMGIDWVTLIGKLPQLIAFIQVAAEMVKRFRAPAGAMSAAVVVPPIHGLVYRPFATAA